MASFTDQIPKFNPYIQQLPVEAMVQVGMEKQKRYDEGVQKIQSQIDNIAGLEVLRPQDKAYLQSRLNELGNNLRTVAAGDFSNFQLVNSVGGMVTQIGKDKIVQAAVQSAARDKQQLAVMEEDRKKGTLTPDNETYYKKQKNAYLNAGLVNDDGSPIVFGGTYVPHFDVFKFAKETFDAVKPDGLTWDQVYVTDGNGKPKIDPKTNQPIYSPVMIRMEKEGIFPERVKATLDQIFSDPRVDQQLSITGQYNYGGMNSAQLRERLASQQEEKLGIYNDKMADLVLKKSLSKDPAAVQTQIDDLQNTIDAIKSNYSDLEAAAANNPDYIRGYLYKDFTRNKYASSFGGWSKTKTQTMDNPGWKANFDLQKEANEQDRWEKKFAFDEKWKVLEYEQKERLAKKGRGAGTGDGTTPTGGGGAGIEQADQPSDIDVVYKMESDYSKAATDFVNSSDSFLWETIFSKVPGNMDKFNSLLSKGNTKEGAISILLNNAAAANKESPESFKSRWGVRAEAEFNRMSPKDVSHDLKDAYEIYKKSKRNFDIMSSVQNQINSATEANLGSDLTRTNLTTDIKPQKVVLYGKEYNLSKDDVYDLAVYLRGHQSALGFLNDSGARKAADAAESRLKARGNDALIEAMLRQNKTSGGPLGVVTMAARAFGTPGRFFSGFTDAYRKATGHGDTPGDIDFSQVEKVYQRIDNDDYTAVMKKKAEIIKSVYGIQPNLKMGILTGDSETDKSIVFDLRRFAGAYTAGQKQNLSPDFSSFIEGLNGDIADMNLEAQVIMDANNNPQIEIVSYYKSDGTRRGGMTIQPDEAASIGLDVNSLYEPRDVSMLRNYIKNKGNQTSANDPKDVNTYISGDAYLEKPDFKAMAGSPYDVKANIKYSNGKYYGYIYISDGTKRTVYTSPGSSNLTDIYTNIVQNTTPAFAQAILSTK